MDTLLIATAFIFGFVARQIGLPPLVGFLTAGFVLNFFGKEVGVGFVFDMYAEAGAGFSNHVCGIMTQNEEASNLI